MRSSGPTCMRCLIPRPADTVGAFSYEGYQYEIDLCDLHARMFDADLSNWVRLSRDVGPIGPAARESVENSVVPFPVADAGVEYLDEREDLSGEEISLDAMSYTFSEHAKFRLNKRGISKTDIFRVISTKNKTIRPSEDNPNALVYLTRELMVVVNPSLKRIITVAYRHEDKKEMQRSGT